MQHTNSKHSYSWEIDLSEFADEWFERGSRDEYESAMRFATVPSETMHFESGESGLRMKELHKRQYNDVMHASFYNSSPLDDDELIEARENFLENIQETYLPHICATFHDSPVLDQGIRYEADVESDEPIIVQTDPEWIGDIMQRALEEEFFPYDSLQEYKQR